MNRVFMICQLSVLSASVAIASHVIPAAQPVQAQTTPIAGQCRATKVPLFAYGNRSKNTALAPLSGNTRVTLAENQVIDGFIAIDQPIAGFIEAAKLKPCPGTTQQPSSPPPAANRNGICLRVAGAGVLVRSAPDANSIVRGAIAPGKQLMTSTNPMTMRQDNRGRNWIQISSPTNGWVTGSTANNDNLQVCNSPTAGFVLPR